MSSPFFDVIVVAKKSKGSVSNFAFLMRRGLQRKVVFLVSVVGERKAGGKAGNCIRLMIMPPLVRGPFSCVLA